MNKFITTNQLGPKQSIPRERKYKAITTNAVQPERPRPTAEERRRLDLRGVITTATVEQLKKAREQKGPEKETPKRKEKR